MSLKADTAEDTRSLETPGGVTRYRTAVKSVRGVGAERISDKLFTMDWGKHESNLEAQAVDADAIWSVRESLGFSCIGDSDLLNPANVPGEGRFLDAYQVWGQTYQNKHTWPVCTFAGPGARHAALIWAQAAHAAAADYTLVTEALERGVELPEGVTKEMAEDYTFDQLRQEFEKDSTMTYFVYHTPCMYVTHSDLADDPKGPGGWVTRFVNYGQALQTMFHIYKEAAQRKANGQ